MTYNTDLSIIVLFGSIVGFLLFVALMGKRPSLDYWKPWLSVFVILCGFSALSVELMAAMQVRTDGRQALRQFIDEEAKEPSHSAIIQKLVDTDHLLDMRGLENQIRIDRLDTRVQKMDTDFSSAIAVIKSQSESNGKILIGLAIGLGVLLLEKLVGVAGSINRKIAKG